MPSKKKFNYQSLAVTTRRKAQKHAEVLRNLLRQTSRSMIEIGQHLIEVRELIPSGSFVLWLRSECDELSQASAYNFMRAATRFGQMPVRLIDRFQPSALVALTAKGVDSDTVDKAIDRARRGEQISHETAQELIGRGQLTRGEADGGGHLMGKTVRQVSRILCNIRRQMKPTQYRQLTRAVARLGSDVDDPVDDQPPATMPKSAANACRPTARVQEASRKLVDELTTSELETLVVVLQRYLSARADSDGETRPQLEVVA